MLGIDFGDGAPDTFMEQHFWLTLSRDAHRVDDIASDHGYDARRIEGRIWGGNLSLLAHLVGTPYFPEIDDGILFVEEVAEEPYAVERLFFQLHHAGVLGPPARADPRRLRRLRAEEPGALSVLDGRGAGDASPLLPYPVLTGLPFGHVARKLTLPFGAPTTLTLRDSAYSLRFSDYTAK